MFALRSTRTSAILPPLRHYSAAPPKPSLKLVAELRKTTNVSIARAREALIASNNDVHAATIWLHNDVATGEQKAAKLNSRSTLEGLIGVSVLSNGSPPLDPTQKIIGGVRAAMVELNCETDFVARNELFANLLADISHTAAFMVEPTIADSLFISSPVELLLETPLISRSTPHEHSGATVATAIRDLISQVGEKISLKRAITVLQPPLHDTVGQRVASYLHGSVGLPTQGRIGTLALLGLKSHQLKALLASKPFQEDLTKLERSLARQIVGFPTTSIRSPPEAKDEFALYEQPFMMFGGSSDPVQQVLANWAQEHGMLLNPDSEEGVQVLDYIKWTVGGL